MSESSSPDASAAPHSNGAGGSAALDAASQDAGGPHTSGSSFARLPGKLRGLASSLGRGQGPDEAGEEGSGQSITAALKQKWQELEATAGDGTKQFLFGLVKTRQARMEELEDEMAGVEASVGSRGGTAAAMVFTDNPLRQLPGADEGVGPGGGSGGGGVAVMGVRTRPPEQLAVVDAPPPPLTPPSRLAGEPGGGVAGGGGSSAGAARGAVVQGQVQAGAVAVPAPHGKHLLDM